MLLAVENVELFRAPCGDAGYIVTRPNGFVDVIVAYDGVGCDCDSVGFCKKCPLPKHFHATIFANGWDDANRLLP